MCLDMTIDTQQATVVWIVCQPFHIVLSLGRLDRNNVVAIDTGANVSFFQAPLAQSFGS
jgi:hypothetical protein